MTLTSRSMEWLNQNRKRAYPMVREAWRKHVSASDDRCLDCVLLDALVFDADAEGTEGLSIESISVSDASTVVSLKYGGRMFSVTLTGGAESGEGSYACVRGTVHGSGLVGASVSLSFSSHAYIHSVVGNGTWSISCPILPTRIICLSDGHGVDGMQTNGSAGVSGHTSPAKVSGEVVLEDGYRTSPVIYDGNVLVRVGKRYGLNPCHYDFGTEGATDCREPMFFFCGQNGVNSGNVVLRGGRGISVTQGRTYRVHHEKSKCNGMRIPCIEIIASKELLDISKPTT